MVTKRPFKLTKAGWVFILYTIGVGAGAINTGNNLLYLVFGVFLGLILASGTLSDLSLWNLEVEWDLPDSFTAEQLSVIAFRLTNHKKIFSSFSVQIELEATLHGQTLKLKTQVPFVGPRESASVHMSFFPVHRGLFQIQHVRLTTQYPFGLLRKWWITRRKDQTFQSETFVYPASFSLKSLHLRSLMLGEDSSAAAGERGEGSVFYGLREYRSSDNPRRIHWKASAKSNVSGIESPNWFIREMEKERELDIHLRLPLPDDTAAMTAPQRELMIRYAASLLQACGREGRRVRFVIPMQGGDHLVIEPQSSFAGQAPDRAEWRFLSLWDPSREPDQTLSSYLQPAADFAPSSASSELDLLTAFHRWRSTDHLEGRPA